MSVGFTQRFPLGGAFGVTTGRTDGSGNGCSGVDCAVSGAAVEVGSVDGTVAAHLSHREALSGIDAPQVGHSIIDHPFVSEADDLTE